MGFTVYCKNETPHIIIYPPNDYRPFDTTVLEELARQLSGILCADVC